MKKLIPVIAAATFILVAVNMVSCINDKAEPETGYPEKIESIVINKCATAGCHNNISHEGAGGLDLTTWNKLLEGSRAGAVVIPYRSDFSTFCYYTNTDTTLGLALEPTMPYNATPLTADEYLTLKNWIDNGAPDNNGFIKFSDYQDKPKLYISNRGCDVVTVMDPASGLAMRYIDVGNSSDIEGPCMVKVAPDKKHWYVIFNQGTSIQKFQTSDNAKVGELNIGTGFWSAVVITGDSKKAFISDADVIGSILYVDIENMQQITTYQTDLRYPFGLCINNNNNTLYATSKEGNYIYKIDITDRFSPLIEEISLETGVPVTTNPTLNPYCIVLSKDESRYFIACNKSSELRVMQTSNDSLLGAYPAGSNPVEMAFCNNPALLFIGCLGVPGTGKKSVINVFDYNAGNFLPEIYAGHDSRGLMTDETSMKLFVANSNVSAGGPDAHHAPVCEGKNGYITAIDLNTLQLVPGFKVELSVNPYHIGK